MTILPSIALSLGQNQFLLPYLQRQFPMPEGEDAEPAPPAAGVKVVVGLDDQGADEEFDAYCAERSLPVAVIVCPAVVGTGMRGLPREIAAGIWRGTFCHIQGNEARISVVHAADVARAAAMAAGSQGSYVLTDGEDPTVRDLAEALAYRIDNKRIFTIKPWMAKIWYGSSRYAALTTDHTEPTTFQQAFPAFAPTPVTRYLRTHVYDASSL